MCKQGSPNVGGTSTNNPPRDINFQYNISQGFALEFGDNYMRVKYNGAYVVENGVALIGVSSSGLFTSSGAHGYIVGDWIRDNGNAGFNGLTWVINSVPSSTTFTVTDLFENAVTSATASSGGSTDRIYTVSSPYAAVDLPYLKFTQSANLMNLTCRNQQTNTEYPPYTLQRVSQRSKFYLGHSNKFYNGQYLV
jgi:hypothetical protein